MIISVEFNKGNDGLEKQTKQSIESFFDDLYPEILFLTPRNFENKL